MMYNVHQLAGQEILPGVYTGDLSASYSEQHRMVCIKYCNQALKSP